MTIDERLEKLKERHEALAESLELMIAAQRENDQHSAERFARYDKLFADNEVRMAQLMKTMNRLGNIVISHEERLDDLEGPST